jgi:lysozyme
MMARVRNRVLGACAALVGVAVAGAGAWFFWLPCHRPDLQSSERLGIDVSHHQGTIDWIRVADDGISFVYIKATEGSTFVDPRYQANWTGSGRAGLDRGAYHFFSLCSPGQEQASNYLHVVSKYAELAPALDLELSPDCHRRPAAQGVRREIISFLSAVELSTGERVLLYVGDHFEAAYPFVRTIERPRWRLGFLLRPSGDDWTVWQVGSLARVDGIATPVGLDVIRDVAPQLRRR